jgi:RecJ-like exonuclease
MKRHNLQLNKELGEVICDVCKGKGNYPESKYLICCPKCQGKKKLDWCEQIVGVAPKSQEHLTFATYIDEIYNDNFLDMTSFQQKMIEDISNYMAVKIDKEILASLNADSEHNINDKKEVLIYDYRVFS